MRRNLAVVTGLSTLLGLGAGYLVADAYEQVPGILVLDRPGEAPLVPRGSPTPSYAPLPRPGTASPLPSAAPAPDATAVERALRPVLGDPRLGPGVGVVVADSLTGERLYAAHAEDPRTPASLAKLLSAVVLVHDLDLAAPLSTRAVLGSDGTLALVAGGDTLLAPGRGAPGEMAGRAGLADLAHQVATAVKDDPAQVRRLVADVTFASGPHIPDTWNPYDVSGGYTRPVSQLALATDRAEPGKASSPDPEARALAAFAAALAQEGVALTPAPRSAWPKAPATGRDVGAVSSAPVREVLGHGLDVSDNALLESLTRIAIREHGGDPAADGATGRYVTGRLPALDIPTTGVRLADASGLGGGSTATADALAAVLTRAGSGTDPGLQDILAGLPVAGLDGTLFDRFSAPDVADVRGIPRAKTGTLTGVSGVAGTTVDADGRVLDYVVLADRVPPATGTLGARAALDEVMAALTRCHCSAD